jgi:hypothetical protein
LLHEMKLNNSVQELLNLREVIVKQALEISKITQKVQDFSQKRIKAQDLFGENELYLNFKKIMSEKDNLIQTLMIQKQSAKPTGENFTRAFNS